jgi:hypothetical protein
MGLPLTMLFSMINDSTHRQDRGVPLQFNTQRPGIPSGDAPAINVQPMARVSSIERLEEIAKWMIT